MAKINEPFVRSLEQLKDGAKYLKLADQLVRDGKYEAALKEIAKARSANPSNLYALAYEDRVRSLLTAKQNRTGLPSQDMDSASSSQDKLRPAIEQLSSLAVMQAQRALDAELKKEQQLQALQRETEERRKNEGLRRAAIQEKISLLLSRTIDYQATNDHTRALAEIERAYLLDPANEQLKILEKQIRQAQQETNARKEEERRRRQQEEEQLRQHLLRAEHSQIEDDLRERRNREFEARRVAKEEKIRQYVQRARGYLSSGQLDDALSELAFVVVIDPLNEEVLALERQIRDRMQQERLDEIEAERRKEGEQIKKLDAIRVTVQKQIETATRLAQQQDFEEALRLVTRAYVVDPLNKDLQECENWILEEQEKAARKAGEQRRAAEEASRREEEEVLKQLEETERERILRHERVESETKSRLEKEKIQGYLSRARQFLTEGLFENALCELALAFVVDPFDEQVKIVEEEVLKARQQAKRSGGTAADGALAEEKTDASGGAAAGVAEHLANAERLRSTRQYDKALEEITRAFVLDPLNQTIVKLENEIQAEYKRYQHEQRQERSVTANTPTVQQHLWRAMEYVDRKQFEEALQEVRSGLAIDDENEDLKILQQQIESAQEEWLQRSAKADDERVIQKHLIRAKQHLAVNAYEEALADTAKGLALNPNHAELLGIQADIKQALAISQQKKGTDARTRAVQRHLQRSKEFCANSAYEDALSEIALGLTVDPENEELKKLEEHLWRLQGAALSAVAGGGVSENAPRTEKEIHETVQIHLRVAKEYQMQNEVAKALDELAKAYVLDPLNDEVRKFEMQIRESENQNHRQQEPPLKLIYPNHHTVGRSK